MTAHHFIRRNGTNTRRRLLIAAVRGLMVMAVLLLLGTGGAPGRTYKNIAFVNQTTCNATISLVTVPAGTRITGLSAEDGSHAG